MSVWLQLSEQLMLVLVLVLFVSVNLGISIGLLFLYIFSIRHRVEKEGRPGTAGEELVSMLESMRSDIANVKEALSRVNLELILERILSLESKVSSLESKIAVLERKLLRPAEAQAVPKALLMKAAEAVVPGISRLSDIPLTFPQVKYAGIITSQGYVVESYGVCSEEPAKLLEVVRIYGTNSASIVKGKSRIEIFHLGEVKDLSNYGILEFTDGSEVSEEIVDRAKRAINKYFTSTMASR